MSRPQTERYRLYRILQDGVTAYDYLQAPEIIPHDVESIGFMGKVYPVFHGRERICGGDCGCGNCVRHTRDIEFEGLQPDVYLDSRTFAFIHVRTYIDPVLARTNSRVYQHIRVTLPYSYAEFSWNENDVGTGVIGCIAYSDNKAATTFFHPDTGKESKFYPSQEEDRDTDEEQAQAYREAMDRRFDPAPLLGVVDSFTAIMAAMGMTRNAINKVKADLTAYITKLEGTLEDV